MMTSPEIRQAFLDFFANKGHSIVPSAPIVVKNDPTLLFTNAGMNQFKDYFLGNKTAPFSRAADTQKCLRVSGKHNDLEEVGVDTYHHTMFEMLGNWSFGDYFKKEAIQWSWQLLTEVFKLDKSRLYVTVFQGDTQEGLPMDEEALQEWQKWISHDRILPGNKKDNFWEMGETGPCGPCSEIHVDCRSDEERLQVDGKTLVNNDHPQVIEIWNNVFMQFNRLKDGSLQPLPAMHVDTGMGFERLVRVIQNKKSNYDTDIFTGTLAAIASLTGKSYHGGDTRQEIAFRVIADHIRAIAFAISDGQLPANTGAGYVIRRILRRAVRYYYSYLDRKEPLLHILIVGLAQQFEHVFPELHQQVDFVTRVVKEEEEAFLRTLEKGILNFNERIRQTLETGDASQRRFDGASAFNLYDTYGFPLDLTQLMARELGWEVDIERFEAEMQIQKNRSRAATAIEAGDWVVLQENIANQFVGYDRLLTNTRVVKYRKVTAKGKDQVQIVLAETPFYAESGGQTGDRGLLIIGGDVLNIVDTKKDNDLIIHFADGLAANMHAGAEAAVDADLRRKTTVHHSVTHLLHAALRHILGKHVAQKGSLNNEHGLRFDFSHFSKTTPEELLAVERLVNKKIRENHPVVIREMPKDEALQLGAMALFGEKYGDMVRVVVMDPDYSVELCGGTHVGYTGELGCFKITGETAVAAGVRRIEALCGEAAENHLLNEESQLNAVRAIFKNPKDIVSAIEGLQAEAAGLRKQLERLEARQLLIIRDELLQKTTRINDLNFIGEIVEVSNADALKKLCFELKPVLDSFVVVLCANIDGKPFVAVSIADNVVTEKGLNAGNMIKAQIAPLIKGGGGGQKNMATAGGQDAGNLAAVIDAVRQML